jgi:hypothetical protein
MNELSINQQVHKSLQSMLSKAAINKASEQIQLNNALRLLSKWRNGLIQNTLLSAQGDVVMQGPFAGMQFLRQSAEGCHIGKLLGCYEQPLHAFIEDAIAAAYPLILNIGCAEGYYAVGMARRMPNTKILAFDLNSEAKKVCITLSQMNEVSDRVEVRDLFKREDFDTFYKQRVLVLCDIEGAENELLNLEISPALKGMDLIVESHECLRLGTTQTIIDRFQKTHNITVVEHNGQRNFKNTPTWFNNLAHLDQLLATWEWRSGPTPWLIMKAK